MKIKMIKSPKMGIIGLGILDPKKVFEPYPDAKNSPFGPQNVKNYPKIKSKSKVRIKENIENKKNFNYMSRP